MESKLSSEQIASLISHGFWPAEIALSMPRTGGMTVIVIADEHWIQHWPVKINLNEGAWFGDKFVEFKDIELD